MGKYGICQAGKGEQATLDRKQTLSIVSMRLLLLWAVVQQGCLSLVDELLHPVVPILCLGHTAAHHGVTQLHASVGSKLLKDP